VVDVETLDFAEISPAEFARLIKDLPKRELATVTAGPSRGRIVDEGQPDIPFEMDIADGTCQVSPGTTVREARLSLNMPAADFARLVSGNATGTALFMTRRLKVTDDLGLAASLVRYFDIPKA
jgi:predicted lipid carrier protein YhbT